MKKKSLPVFVLSALLVIALVVIAVLVTQRNTPPEEAPTVIGGGEPIPEAENAVKDDNVIHLPAYGSLTFKAGTKEQETVLQNPGENSCLIRISLILSDGTTVYQSELVKPGYYTQPITLIAPMERGIYRDVTLQYDCYTVTFSGATVSAQTVDPDEKVTKPSPDPARSGCTFGGWYADEDCKQAWNFEQDTVVGNMTLYAKWIENSTPKAIIHGNVTESSSPVPNATVELFLGVVKVAATKTDEQGQYSFDNVENGTYNIVVTKEDGKTKTELVTVNTTGGYSVDVELPDSDVSSIVEHNGEEIADAKSDISQTVVGGLDKIALSNAQEGDIVKVKLTVEPKKDADTVEPQKIKNEAGDGKKVEFLDLTLTKTVNGVDTPNFGSTNNQLLTIVVPFDFTGMDGSEPEQPERPVRPGGGSYAAAVNSTENGTVTLDKKFASAGDTVTITVKPDKGYTLETLTVLDKNGKEVEVKNLGNNKYSFRMPNGKVTVSATFMEDNTMLNFFVDVKATDYYYDAVLWAAKNDITKGTDATHFSPDIGTTRAQVVTFLWRAAGCPEPKGDANKFVDVERGSYYEKAVAWAIEQGITKGTSATTFSPDVVCTRAQIVAFLARFAGVADEDTGYKHGFTDVKATDYFNNAVAWAKDNKVTEGTSATTFSPNTDCTRAQVVTFLYRWMVR